MVFGNFHHSFFIVIFLLWSYKQCTGPTLLSIYVPKTFGFSIMHIIYFHHQFGNQYSIWIFFFNIVNLNLQLEACWTLLLGMQQNLLYQSLLWKVDWYVLFSCRYWAQFCQTCCWCLDVHSFVVGLFFKRSSCLIRWNY